MTDHEGEARDREGGANADGRADPFASDRSSSRLCQGSSHRATGSGKHLAVPRELEAVAGRRRQGVELEGCIGRLGARWEFPRFDGDADFALKHAEPAIHRSPDGIA
jgi:hypothetical protein